MSFREIDVALSRISKRKNTEYASEALLHGVQLEMPSDDTAQPKVLNEKQKKALEQVESMSIAERRKAIRDS